MYTDTNKASAMTASVAESESGADVEKEAASEMDKEASQNILQVWAGFILKCYLACFTREGTFTTAVYGKQFFLYNFSFAIMLETFCYLN